MMFSVKDYFEGNNNLSEDEEAFAEVFAGLGRHDLAKIVRGSRTWQRFHDFGAMLDPTDKDEYDKLSEGLFGVLSTKGGEGSGVQESFHDWKIRVTAELQETDSDLRALVEAQNQ